MFQGKIRLWTKSQIILLHLFSLFTPVNKIYKLNKNIKNCFNYFFDFDSKLNPLKDDVYELQKNIPDIKGQELKKSLLKYYYENNFLDLTITFIDGHIIAYFGNESFQKLKHSTRNAIIKSMEVFNFSDKHGRIFYFKADHDVEGMKKNIELLLYDVEKIIGLDKVKILVFDRGGYSKKLFNMLNKEFNLKFITLAVKSKKIQKQIDNIIKNNIFETLKGNNEKQFIISTLNIGETNYRTLLIRNKPDGKIHPFITNMNIKELSNQELLQYYSMHWNQEQEHNAFGKLGGNMHSKALQETDFEDTTKINRSIKITNKINKLTSKSIQLNQELKRITGLKIALTSKIRPKSKQTDNKIVRKQLADYNTRIKEIRKNTITINDELNKLENRLKKIPANPTKKKFKHGPVDYSISITNLANNLNSKLMEIATKGNDKFQLSTLIGSFYSISANVSEDEKTIYVEYFNMRQKKQITMIKNLCDYFNQKNIKLREKIIKFAIKI